MKLWLIVLLAAFSINIFVNALGEFKEECKQVCVDKIGCHIKCSQKDSVIKPKSLINVFKSGCVPTQVCNAWGCCFYCDTGCRNMGCCI